MSFFLLAADLVGKLVLSLGSRQLGDKLKDIRTQRRLKRLVDDAVDRIVGQTEEYLSAEKISGARKEILITALGEKLQSSVDDPQQFFASDLDGSLIFKKVHPNGQLPRAIQEEGLEQFYTVLFPQIAHFLAGSRIAIAQWEAEGLREEFKRLSQLAEEIRAMNAKVAEIPGIVAGALARRSGHGSETVLRGVSQTLLNSILLKLDLSPLRAERVLHGALGDHFVVPAIRERDKMAQPIGQDTIILSALATQGRRCIIHGGVGTGKTTCSLWLQSRLLQGGAARLALLLRLREVTDIENHSLLELLRDRATPHLREALSDNILRNWYGAGKLVLILDGFDEVPEERRDAVEKWIIDLGVVGDQVAIIVTSRPLQSGHLCELEYPWRHWDLLPFDEPRIVEFIARWHRYLPEEELSPAERQIDAAALARTFFEDPSLKPLADTPLMLGTLLFVHHRDKKLPSGRVDLYERYIGAMLGLRDSGLGIQARATKLTDKEKRRVLAYIAVYFHLNGINEVNDTTMRRLVTEALETFHLKEDVDRLLPALRERTGLLQGPGSWSFMHKTIGEFLVAELICDGNTRLADKRRLDRKELWVHRHQDPWTAVLFFWAGKTTSRELEEFVEELLNEGTDNGNLLALSLLHDQGDRLNPETQRTFVIRLIQQAQPHEDKSTGKSACSVPAVPRIAYSKEYSASNFDLRGLTSTHNTNALTRLFEQGILTPADLQICHPSLRDGLSISFIWGLGRVNSEVAVKLRNHLDHVPSDHLALYFYIYRCQNLAWKYDATLQDTQDAVAEWIAHFPEGRRWILLLLLGSVFTDWPEHAIGRHQKKRIGPLIWQWRNEPIDENWLFDSDQYRGGWSEFESGDFLKKMLSSLRKEDASDWGLTIEQHHDLLSWVGQLIAQRDILKRIEPKK